MFKKWEKINISQAYQLQAEVRGQIASVEERNEIKKNLGNRNLVQRVGSFVERLNV